MAESDRRNPTRATASPSAGEPTRLNGGTALPIRIEESQTADGKYRLAETLTGTASVSISRERVFLGNGKLATQLGSLIVVTTSNRDDDIRIRENRDSTLDVDVNGKQFHITLGGRQRLAVRSLGGNDAIFASGVESDLRIDAGSGNDLVVAGSGSDQINGNDGDDTILAGSGDNDVNGGDGNDTLGIGGNGNDVAYGGKGNDIVMRGQGRGIKYVDSGDGNDRVSGGLDKSIVSPGPGKNQVVHSNKDDHVFASRGIDPDLGSSIEIVGTPAFRERVESDLNTLRSSPFGRQMLGSIDLAARTTGNSVTITELSNELNGRATGSGDIYLKGTRKGVVAGTGANATVDYNPSFRGGSLPIIVLYHELSHAHNIITGTLQPGFYFGPGIDGQVRVGNSELQAVGLPNDGFKYFGGDGKSNPEALTENGLRKEMGLPLRGSYTFPAPLPATSIEALPESLKSTANYLNDIAAAVLTNGPQAVQKGFDDLLASASGQKFFKEGAAELESQAAAATQKNSSDVEQAAPLRPGRSR